MQRELRKRYRSSSMRASLAWLGHRCDSRWIGVGFAIFAVAFSLEACGEDNRNNPITGGPAFIGNLNNCLERHGIPRPGDLPKPTEAELAIPALRVMRGMRVPVGISRQRFREALNKCGYGYLKVAPEPITNPIVKGMVLELRSCLARNGFMLPYPNFVGGPILDTRSVDIRSAMWVATVKGCGVTSHLTRGMLMKCISPELLRKPASKNGPFEEQLVELHHCLDHLA